MEIYEVLQRDHVELKQSLSELISLKEDDEYRFVLMEEISNALVPHSRAEEAVFYNTLRAVNADKSLVRHGYKEHLEAETLLRTMQIMDKLDVSWKATAEKLLDAVSHHINDEETDIFTEARSVFTSEEATMMAEAFEELKAKVSQEGIVKNTMDMVINMMPPKFADKIRDIGTGSQA
ncbi:MAG TPA: hemerythrin domain-containing protein [Bacteriovoracaceae bacterium]|nr:hemerythrin domain-containing protein [Bacteriovoracaceae bacterium]